MDGYLLDTNILTYLFDEGSPRHSAVMSHFAVIPTDRPLFISAITLGEIEFGHRCESEHEIPIQRKFNVFLREMFPLILDVRDSTRFCYGMIRASLFHKYRPRAARRPKWPEDLMDQATAKALGVQENDLWLAAQALENNLVLVTNDRMARIRGEASPALRVENWATA